MSIFFGPLCTCYRPAAGPCPVHFTYPQPPGYSFTTTVAPYVEYHKTWPGAVQAALTKPTKARVSRGDDGRWVVRWSPLMSYNATRPTFSAA